jgi:phosphate starvation-inducible PhoH-like protein
MAQPKGRKPRNKKTTIREELEEIDSMDNFIREQVLSYQFKINCKFKNKKQKEMYDTIMENRITFVNGVAGSGKTLVALMAGLECIKNKSINISQIVLTKPIVEISTNKGLGALPGDLDSKTLPYFTHFYDNLIKIIGNEATGYLKQNGVIKETVLNYVRGSTFGKYTADGKPVGTFCIFDETQNCTTTEMKTFISRMGEESKMVILGDSDQIDIKLQKGERCGLEDAIERLKGIDKIGFIEFTEDDIVRDPFLIEIMKRYKLG